MHENREYNVGAEVFFKDLSLENNQILFVGQQKCAANHSYGPAIRPYFLLVYVVAGKGTFRMRNQTYHLGAGTSFVVFPGERVFYVADAEDPWHYYWVAFQGDYFRNNLERASISLQYPVMVLPDPAILGDLFETMMVYTMEENQYVDIKIYSLFLDILYQCILYAQATQRVRPEDMAKSTSPHIDKAIEYIHKNYGGDLSVSGIADELGITREHFSKLFKTHFKVSPVNFIRNFRLQSARILLLTTDLSIADIAERVNFSDYNYFSTQFRKLYGIAPGAFRKTARQGAYLKKHKEYYIEVR